MKGSNWKDWALGIVTAIAGTFASLYFYETKERVENLENTIQVLTEQHRKLKKSHIQLMIQLKMPVTDDLLDNTSYPGTPSEEPNPVPYAILPKETEVPSPKRITNKFF